MESLFKADFFVGNRARLRTLFKGTAPIVMTAHGLLQRNGTGNYAFRQDSNFWYLTGISEPDIILVMDKQKEYLILPSREPVMEKFDGALSAEALAARSGITTVYEEKEGWRQLTSRLKRVKHVAGLAPPAAYLEFYGLYTNPARSHLLNKIKAINPDIEQLDLRQHLATMRMVKQPPELLTLQKAIDITVDTIKAVSRRNFAKYEHEYDVEAEITAGFRKRGALGHGFTPIVASGQNACTIHYLANNAPLNKKSFLLLDIGAEVDQYSADISRTFCLSTANKRQRQIYEAVADVQQFAYGKLKPGTIIKEYEQAVEAYMGEKLRELGLIKSAEHDAIRQYYPHATSHHLGLDAHDAADYDKPLEPNMVITVEPGIYIPEEGIGVRLEDDVLLTDDGVDILSKTLPSELKHDGKMRAV